MKTIQELFEVKLKHMNLKQLQTYALKGVENGTLKLDDEYIKSASKSLLIKSILRNESYDSASIEAKLQERIDVFVNEQIEKQSAIINEKIAVRTISVRQIDGTEINVGTQHYLFESLLNMISNNLPVMLVGPAGSGKTTVSHNIAIALKLDFRFMSVGSQTTKTDIMGYMDATGHYVTSHFREAYEHGGVFLMDEIDAGNPNVLTVMNAALSNGTCPFPDKMVNRHKDFRFIAAANTYGRGNDRMYVGRNQLDAATLDRFIVVNFDYDEQLEMSICSNKEWCTKVQTIRKIVFNMKEKVVVSPRASLFGSTLLELGHTEEEVMDMTIFKGMNHEIKNKVMYALRNC